MNNLKVAIYAICKNELQFVDKWFESMIEADYICVLDTGSTDGTYEELLKWQKLFPSKIIVQKKTYDFWRFDVARNDSLELVPEDTDIYWSTDLDEVLEKGWSTDLKNNWTQGQTRGLYLYSWSHTDTGAPGRVFWYDKIHTKDYKWIFPVHETLYYTGKDKEVAKQISSRILLHHYPDLTKSRSNYLNLLLLRAEENKNSDEYGKIYLCHEYMVQNMYKECIEFINSHAFGVTQTSIDALFMPNILSSLGECYYRIDNKENAERSFRLGIASFPLYRENYLQLIVLLMEQNRAQEAEEVLKDMFSKTRRFYSWLEKDLSWSWFPYDLAAWVYLGLNNKLLALDYAFLAYNLNPVDELKNKYEAIKAEVLKNATCELTPVSELNLQK